MDVGLELREEIHALVRQAVEEPTSAADTTQRLVTLAAKAESKMQAAPVIGSVPRTPGAAA